jgi:hypothetical protein
MDFEKYQLIKSLSNYVCFGSFLNKLFTTENDILLRGGGGGSTPLLLLLSGDFLDSFY